MRYAGRGYRMYRLVEYVYYEISDCESYDREYYRYCSVLDLFSIVFFHFGRF